MSGDAAPREIEREDAFRVQLERSAAALVAVARRVARDRPLGGGEDAFLALYARVEAADPAVFARVWSDPQAYAWAKRAFEALARVVRGADGPEADADAARAALAAALEGFAPFALACAHLAGERLELACGFGFAGRLPIPATAFALEAAHRAEWRGVADGAVLVAPPGAGAAEAVPLADGAKGAASGVAVSACPTLAWRDEAIRLEPTVFRDHLPESWLDAPDLALQARHRDVLARALGFVERFHPAAAQLSERLRVVAFKPEGASLVGNTSSSELPGAVAFCATDDPWMLSESLVHELHHQQLFALEMQGPLFADREQSLGRDFRHYSPWRTDPRPIKGVLHGVHVYVEVARHWLAVLASEAAEDEPGRWRAHERLPWLSLRLPWARATIREYARFAPLGAAVWEETERRLERAVEAIRAAGIDARGSETERRFHAHVERHDTQHALARLVPRMRFEARPHAVDAEARSPAPRVSCLCVTRGRVARLECAVRCFREQTHPDRELVVVHEADDPETEAFLDAVAPTLPGLVPVRVAAEPRRTLGELRNLAVEHATGEWVCQWDDDDWHHPERIAAQLEAVRGVPGATACVLARWIVFHEGRGRAYLGPWRSWEGSILARRDALPAYPAVARGEDTVVVDALDRAGALALLERPEVYVYVLHGGNTWPVEHFADYADETFFVGEARSAEVAEALAKASPA